MLLDDTLDFSRKQQVYTHLNSNAALYQQWLGLVEAQALLSLAQPQTNKRTERSFLHTLQQWFGPTHMAVTGAACAGIFAIALLWPSPDDGLEMHAALPSPTVSSQADRPLENGIRFGFINAYQTLPQAQQQALALAIPATTTPSQHTQGIGLGYALLDAYQGCQTNSSYTASPLLSAQLQALLPALINTPPPATFCGVLTDYIGGLIAVN